MYKTLREHFRIITDSGTVELKLFEDDFENSRKAAVQLTLEYLFQRK